MKQIKVYLKQISGIDDAISSLYISKRSWTTDIDEDIRSTCDRVLDRRGFIKPDASKEDVDKLMQWIDKLSNWGWQHITLLRFIDFTFAVRGLHRGGQDDWDAHAQRFNNRIIRSSTRLARFGNEKSNWYNGKIITTDEAINNLDIMLPETIEVGNLTYVKAENGYVREDYKNDNDVLRGLYMLSIPSNFIFKANLTEFSHVYKERNKNGSANPEVKLCCEACADAIESAFPQFDRELLKRIKN